VVVGSTRNTSGGNRYRRILSLHIYSDRMSTVLTKKACTSLSHPYTRTVYTSHVNH